MGLRDIQGRVAAGSGFFMSIPIIHVLFQHNIVVKYIQSVWHFSWKQVHVVLVQINFD